MVKMGRILTFEIWWKDLTKEAQQEYLELFGRKEEDMDDYTMVATVDIDEDALD
jgi:hypothetical protein